ncbi:transposase [Streptomyces sp. AHU1]|uniref:transposase n=1 Tax=Streptomyces sp. AHU1 TaxID=3377215 RepID=UPI003877A9A6
MSRKGKAWGSVRRPRRLRATYDRYDGVRQMLAALDLATGKLYVVLDNFSPHKHAKVRTWATDNNNELVFLPTYGSWLNWLEAEFAALRYFALNGTDHRSHDEQNAAIAAYARRRNTHAKPKTSFAPDSPIRSWTDYPAKAA